MAKEQEKSKRKIKERALQIIQDKEKEFPFVNSDVFENFFQL